MSLKHIKIRTTLLTILLVFSAMLVLLAIDAWRAARNAHQALTELNRVTEEQTVPVTNTLITVLRARLAVIAAEAEYQNGNLANARHSHEASARFAREAAALFKPFMVSRKSDATRGLAQRMEQQFADFEQAVSALNRALDNRDRDAFLAANLKARNASEGYYSALLEFQQQMNITRKAGMEAAQGSYDTAVLKAIGVTLLSLLLVGLSLWFVRRQIVAPLQQASDHFKVMAAGDLSRDIDTSSSNEIGELFVALQEMQQSKRAMIRSLMESSSQLASAAEELNSVTEESQRGLQEQSDQLQQAATAITELSTAVDDVAGNAVTTSEASQASNELAVQCREGVRVTTTDIQAVSDGVEQTAAQVAELAQHSRNIGQILDVIQDVAEQTNLLALNAAIEAARAGEAGRGFAVVADEVRTLAQRTQSSTTEIEKLITAMRQGTTDVMQSMEQSRARAERTLTGAANASSALEEIFESISQINDRNLVIASAAEEQAQVAREVDQNLVNIRDLATQTAAGANQTSAASQELSRLAVELNDSVVHFRT
ncbi:methyl-accepting chemotaxis protein [Marinobacterium weihaiense]|uniref:Tar ligand binding domain-containing protein n=1 Tax=Marinobacterium weihaiense TaxID=2851016 RepID=A0ABS6M9M3_9GAMM|nr:methyl-accepting chemotaxis protein [Marinobacterium weihaiense]MBV0932591.1 Tar ligand binding domain-containing protein [Marinobacterium weihaiense]